jgi:cytoskeleton protein RodZ
MSESGGPLMNSASSGDLGGQASAGTLLRRAREQAGLHIGALAVSLKVPVKKLEALEADRLDLLPDAVFARALAGTVCRILKVDPVPVLAAFPQTNAQRDNTERTARQPTFRPSGHSSQKSLMERLSRPFILLGFAFAIGALVLMFFPAIQQFAEDVKKGVESSGAPVARQTPPSDNLSAPTVTSAGSAAGADLSINDAKAAAAAPTNTASVAVASEPAPTAQIATEPVEILMLTARGNSWVEVTDAKRLVVLRKTMVVGESQNLGGVLPLAVILGRANLLDVQVRGKAVDLLPLTKDNVARFEVK